ncbi:MAG: flagellar biosynthesis protein FlhF [Bacteriovoracia bacterium]
MQVKKFEAPTIQEALETIKRDLGPDAIILQTKNIRGGFGLLSKSSVEVTAAVSEKSLQKKKTLETKLPTGTVEAMQKLPASKQAEILERYPQKTLDRYPTATRPGASGTSDARQSRKLTATRYIDIDTPPVSSGASASPGPVASAPSVRTVLSPAVGTPPIKDAIRQEIDELKQMLGEMKSSQEIAATSGASGSPSMGAAPAFNNPAVRDSYELLVVNGLEKKHAHLLVKQAVFALDGKDAESPDQVMDQVAEELVGTIEVASLLEGITPKSADASHPPAAIALLGPTGVGKTTTLAKIASDAVLNRGLKVGLINVDSYKIAAADQLSTYAKILNVPFRSVADAEELRVALQEFNRFDVVLIDTTGRSQRDMEHLNQMRDLLAAVPNLRTALVLSSTTRDTELYDIGKRFSGFKPGGLILSKLDEALVYGSIYNVSHRLKLPLMYFTTGQRVPEDIEEATAERLAALVLDL